MNSQIFITCQPDCSRAHFLRSSDKAKIELIECVSSIHQAAYRGNFKSITPIQMNFQSNQDLHKQMTLTE